MGVLTRDEQRRLEIAEMLGGLSVLDRTPGIGNYRRIGSWLEPERKARARRKSGKTPEQKRDERRARCARYDAEHKPQALARFARWKRNNRPKVSASKRRRREELRAAKQCVGCSGKRPVVEGRRCCAPCAKKHAHKMKRLRGIKTAAKSAGGKP